MANDDDIKALNARIAELSRRVGLMEDTHAVRTLHFKYGYYIDKCLYDEAVDLLSSESAPGAAPTSRRGRGPR